MIAKLTGIVDEILDEALIIDVSGVGYQVFATSKLLQSAVVGERISVRVLHIFKQDAQYLCGFQNGDEIGVFKALLDVPGIGVKSALAVLSTLSIAEFATAVAMQDAEALRKVNGIGRKTAERVLLELKDKSLPKLKDVSTHGNENLNDAMLGLISLGYQKGSILPLLKEISQQLGATATANELILAALKRIK